MLPRIIVSVCSDLLWTSSPFFVSFADHFKNILIFIPKNLKISKTALLVNTIKKEVFDRQS